jgi:hypothetical protein
MKINKLVTSLEVSRKFKELGILQESCFYWVDWFVNENLKMVRRWELLLKKEILKEFHDHLDKDYPKKMFEKGLNENRIISAFTLTEICHMEKVAYIYWETPNTAANCIIEMYNAAITSFKPKYAKEENKEYITQINANIRRLNDE